MYLTSFPLYSKGRICEGSDMRGSAVHAQMKECWYIVHVQCVRAGTVPECRGSLLHVRSKRFTFSSVGSRRVLPSNSSLASYSYCKYALSRRCASQSVLTLRCLVTVHCVANQAAQIGTPISDVINTP